MRGTLDPRTLEKIEAFAHRRKRLILARGLCAVFTILLAAMSALALVDSSVVMPDEARWALSAAAYGAALFAAWYTCARLIWSAPDARVLARFIEELRPDLREDLLSAVELGDPRGRQEWESEDFREILQKDIAGRIETVRVDALLSYRRIARWGYAAVGILGVTLILFLIPGLRYDNWLLRSLLPGANLERISRVRITVLEPSPPETTVPQGDVVPVRVLVSDPEVRTASLETFVQGKKTERSEMTYAGKGVFESGLAIGREPVSYRVRSADAMTRKYALRPVSRPEAIGFVKTYHYPEYTEKKPETEDAREKGDLITLEGTTVDLKIRVNQEVEVGNLQIEQAGKSSTLKLEPSGEPNVLQARILVNASGTYKVFLRARETRFENKFSPQYEIRSMPDLVPRVTLEEPNQDLILPPDEVILVRGTATDDLGLRRVLQVIRVNQGDWKEVTLAERAGLKFTIAHRWDLFDLKVQPGDHVTTKLVAIDLKGNRAESQPVHITVTAPGFDPQRLVPLAAKEQVYSALVDLRDALRDAEKKASEAARGGGDELARKQALVSAAADAEKAAGLAETAEARSKDALRLSRGGREAGDLVAVARLVRRLREDALARARSEVDRNNLGASGESLKRAAEQAAGAEDAFRDLLASEEAIAILNDLRDLGRDEAAIRRQTASAQAVNDSKTWERLARRQGVAASQARSIDEVLQVLSQRAREGEGRVATAIRQQLKAPREVLEKALAANADPALGGPSEAMRSGVETALTQFHGLEILLGRRAHQARETLAKRSEPSHADLAALVREVGEKSPRVADHAQGVRVQLEARAAVEESRKDQDPFFVADSALAGRALQAVLEAHLAQPDPARSRESFGIVERAYRTLETGHGLQEMATSLREMAEEERWASGSPGQITRHPKDWQWFESRAEKAGAEFKAAALPVEALSDLQKSWRGPSGDQLRREMNERLAFGRKPLGAAAPLERLGSDLARGHSAIQPAMEAARRELQKLVPSLAERLERLAADAEAIRKETKSLAEKAPAAQAAETRAEARSRLETQREIDKQIDQVMTDLRREANLQDLFSEKGREKARDADDAVAMLQQTPPKAEDLLAQAASSPQPQAQEQTLTKASEQQQKLADALKTVAEHYKNAQAGKPEETRPELRKAEEALGIKDQLDKRYAEMAKLAELANQPSDTLKAALQSEVAQNDALQRQLEQLAQNSLDRAEQALQQAAQMEEKAARDAGRKMQEAEAQGRTLSEQARKIAEQARQMARQDVPRLNQEAEKAQAPAAQAPLAKAAADLEKGAADIPQNPESSPKAAEGLEAAAKDLSKAAEDLAQAAQAEQAAAQTAQKKNQAEQAQSKAAADQAKKQSQAADRAKQASAQADQAAKEAKQAAAKQPENAQAREAAEKASAAAQDAKKSADQADTSAKEAQAAAQKEAQAAAQTQASEQSAQAAAQHSGQEAQQARELAQKAQALAQAAKAQSSGNETQSTQAAQAQAEVGQMVQQAAADIRQAARNEQALGNAEQAQTLEQVGQATEAVAQNEVQAAQQAAKGQSAPSAQQADQRAQAAIQAQAGALAQARAAAAAQSHPPASDSPAGEPSGLAESASQLLAQALNALNGEPGAPPSAPGQAGQEGQAQQAVQAAAQAQQQSMAQSRSQGQQGQGQGQGNQPGQMPFSQAPGAGKGASVEAGRQAEGQLPPGALLKPGDWGKLPPRLARDLMEGQRESVSGEYRTMVETYFKVIAERARERK